MLKRINKYITVENSDEEDSVVEQKSIIIEKEEQKELFINNKIEREEKELIDEDIMYLKFNLDLFLLSFVYFVIKH